ncbi:hypothetical protein LCGC14_2379410, partial [marine sediment metagenome]
MSLEEMISPVVYRKLAKLRWMLRAHLIGRGLCWLIVAASAAVFITLAIDYSLGLDRVQRALIMALAVGGMLYVLWRFLVRPLRVPMDDQELALVVEDHYPQFGDRLISSLQLAGPGGLVGASAAMAGRMIRQGSAMAEDIRAGDVVNRVGTWKLASWPGGALAALLALTLWQADIMGLWFQRNVLLADVPYPRQTYLSIAGGPEFKVIRGDSLTVEVTAEGVIPPSVSFHMRFPGLGKVTETVPSGAERGVYSKTFENVSDAFEFRVAGNDDRTGKFNVIVVDPPELVDLRGIKRAPDYMNLPQGEAFDAGVGIIPVWPGTRLFLADRNNNRILIWNELPTGNTAPDLVLGQEDFYT